MAINRSELFLEKIIIPVGSPTSLTECNFFIFLQYETLRDKFCLAKGLAKWLANCLAKVLAKRLAKCLDVRVNDRVDEL